MKNRHPNLGRSLSSTRLFGFKAIPDDSWNPLEIPRACPCRGGTGDKALESVCWHELQNEKCAHLGTNSCSLHDCIVTHKVQRHTSCWTLESNSHTDTTKGKQIVYVALRLPRLAIQCTQTQGEFSQGDPLAVRYQWQTVTPGFPPNFRMVSLLDSADRRLGSCSRKGLGVAGARWF
jgi:hypothetical protein